MTPEEKERDEQKALRASCLYFVKSPFGHTYAKELAQIMVIEQNKLMHSDDQATIYRSQGALRLLEHIMRIPNNYLPDKED